MAVITPNSDVILLHVPLEISDINQLTFANATAQYNYFNGLTSKKAFDKFTYQRKDHIIRIPDVIDNLYSYNYVMYRNTGYSNKWFYAFITDLTYVNDSVTDVTIKTDVWQTWQFDLTYKATFVEREHVNDDTIGLHTVPENLELGEYVLNGSVINSDLSTSSSETNVCYICFQVSDYPNTSHSNVSPAFPSDVTGHKVGGVYTGLDYIMVLSASDANSLIKCYALDDKPDAIVSIFSVPFGAINATNMSVINRTSAGGNFTTFMFTGDSSTPISIDSVTITKPTTLDSYTPINNKLKTYPYCYFYGSNNAGIETEYYWEDFSSDPAFNIDGVISQGMSIKAYPTNYKRGTNLDGYAYGISGGKLPICAWNNDYYVNWCTQNAINIPLNLTSTYIKSGLMIGGAIASGGTLGAMAGATGGLNILKGIGDVVNQRYQASLVPDQAKGNANCGDINVAETRFGFTFYPMSIKAEYASICDKYFNMFGYKVNTVKIPNITGRTNWNYVKTIGCYIQADIPQDDLAEIKSMFDKGITLWHNPTTFADYTQSNAIVS